jgi:hypothetical protein
VAGQVHHQQVGEELLIPAGTVHSVLNIGKMTAQWLYGYKRPGGSGSVSWGGPDLTVLDRRSRAGLPGGRGRLRHRGELGWPMNDRDRCKLLHGPYRPPRLRRRDRATCLYRDADVVITSWSDGRISWPRCRRLGRRGHPGLLVDEELARAVRTESVLAIAYWWGVNDRVVFAWRKALGVEKLNEGSARLRLGLNRELAARKRGKRLPPRASRAPPPDVAGAEPGAEPAHGLPRAVVDPGAASLARHRARRRGGRADRSDGGSSEVQAKPTRHPVGL